jgi:prepilin-type N-terminal cleavage/methylation domain-containing protein
MKKYNFPGFTMIELLVVIVIIGILSFVAVSSYNNSRSKSRDAVRLIELNQIIIALETYYDDHNFRYPNCSGVCDNLDSWKTCLGTALKPYLEQIPVDPLNDPLRAQYCYYMSSYDSSHKTLNRADLLFTLENINKDAGKFKISSEGLFNYTWRIKDYE